MKFVVFVEGDVEQKVLPKFLKGWLDPQLSKPVGVQIVNLAGCYKFSDDVARHVALHLRGTKAGEVVACIGLLDLHAPDFYPEGVTAPQARYDWGRQHIEKSVGSPRFRQYFAVHELEAWVLGQPDVLPPEVKKALPGKCKEPEAVDFDEPPAKLLRRLYRQRLNRAFKKTTEGVDLFARLDPTVVRGKCPKLRAMLDDLLELARAAGL